MSSQYRIDKALLGMAVKTPEGYIEDTPVVTRTGVFQYVNPDGSIRRELRHPRDVFAAESLATLRMLPMTNGHPAEMVTAANAKALSVGYTGESPLVDGQTIAVPLRITDAAAVIAVEAGRRALSLGYSVDCIEETGVYDGEAYDCRQTRIRYNHLALVDQGRAGDVARLNMDAAEQIETPANEPERKDTKVADLVKVNLDGLTYDAAPEVSRALEKARADHAEISTKLAEQTARADRAEAERDAAKEKIEALEKRDNAADIAAAVKARVALEKAATAVLDGDTAAKLDGMTDAEIRVAVIKAQSPNVNLDGKSDDYIAARFDSALEGLEATRAAAAAQRSTGLSPLHNDSADDPYNKFVRGLDYRTARKAAN